MYGSEMILLLRFIVGYIGECTTINYHDIIALCCLSPSALFSGPGAISLQHPRSESIFK